MKGWQSKLMGFKKDKEWNPVSELPNEDMKVKWLCEDGVEDVGFYYYKQKQFATNDHRSTKLITHWKPL